MSKVFYTFFLESEPGIAATHQTPSFDLIKMIPTGTNLPVDTFSIVNLGDGLYGFEIDWTNYSAPVGGIKPSIFVKLDTGIETLDQKYLQMRVERHDYLPELVDNVQASADSIQISADSIITKADLIHRIQTATWAVEGTVLRFWDGSLDEVDRTPDNSFLKFNCYDLQGNSTNEDIRQRRRINE
jgi:hypothetical protein